MFIVCVTVLFPMWNMLVISLSRVEDVTLVSLNLFPKKNVFDAYKYIFSENRFMSAMVISVSRTVIGTLYHIVVTYLAAYALTRRKMTFLKVITVLFLITIFLNGGLIPTYIMMNSMKITNNFLIYVLPQAFSMFTVIIVRNSLFSIDSEIEEAAFIDGAGPLQTMIRIMQPLSKPVLATIALWHMVQQWNSWIDNLIYNSGTSAPKQTQILAGGQKRLNSPVIAKGMRVSVKKRLSKAAVLTALCFVAAGVSDKVFSLQTTTEPF